MLDTGVCTDTGVLEDGICENPMDSPAHPMGLWDGTGHWDLGQGGICENPMDSPVHPMGLWEDCGMRWQAGTWG